MRNPIDRKDLSRLAQAIRSQGKTIITTNGCYDILHVGHAHTFREAKLHGDVLIVGVNSDASVRELKGKYRPLIGELDRAQMVSELEAVDYVHIFNEADPNEFLRQLRPDYHLKSREGYKGLEGPVMAEWGGEVVLIDDLDCYSTSDIVAAACKAYVEEAKNEI